MFLTTSFLLILCLVEWATSQDCPVEYQRLSPQHTFCRKPNPSCQFRLKGLYDQQNAINEIINTHNEFRNKVATGNENNMPTATNMLQMTWDYELAKIAQKWAENCEFRHDCGDCRSVENYYVGQNLGLVYFGCNNCGDDKIGKYPDWKGVIKSFYDEVNNLNRKNIASLGSEKDSGVVGHFTQLAWAKTWRVGCGFSSYMTGNTMNHLFVCNYGPGGNYGGSPIYKAGPTCSECPINSCCGRSCPGGQYDGLCKMNKDEAPKYPREPGVFFYCDFAKLEGDCSLWLKNYGALLKSSALSGTVLSQELKGGQDSEINFNTPLRPSDKFCLRILYRKSASDITQTDRSALRVDMKVGGSSLWLDAGTSTKYYPLNINMQKLSGDNKELKLTLKFSVPAGAPTSTLDIKEISANNGSC